MPLHWEDEEVCAVFLFLVSGGFLRGVLLLSADFCMRCAFFWRRLLVFAAVAGFCGGVYLVLRAYFCKRYVFLYIMLGAVFLYALPVLVVRWCFFGRSWS